MSKLNIEAVERIEQSHGAKIERLFWIAGSLSNNDFDEVLSGMTDEEFQGCFPEIYQSEYYEEYKEENQLGQALVDYKKFGLLAEVHIPEAYNFKYNNEKLVSWAIHGGVCLIEYVYAESLEELLEQIEKAGDKVFQECLAKAKAA